MGPTGQVGDPGERVRVPHLRVTCSAGLSTHPAPWLVVPSRAHVAAAPRRPSPSCPGPSPSPTPLCFGHLGSSRHPRGRGPAGCCGRLTGGLAACAGGPVTAVLSPHTGPQLHPSFCRVRASRALTSLWSVIPVGNQATEWEGLFWGLPLSKEHVPGSSPVIGTRPGSPQSKDPSPRSPGQRDPSQVAAVEVEAEPQLCSDT